MGEIAVRVVAMNSRSIVTVLSWIVVISEINPKCTRLSGHRLHGINITRMFMVVRLNYKPHTNGVQVANSDVQWRTNGVQVVYYGAYIAYNVVQYLQV